MASAVALNGSYLREAWRRRSFAIALATSRIRAQSSSTFFGTVWSLFNPLMLGAVYLFVFSVILKTSRGEPAFMVYLLSGIFAFYYTRSSAMGAPSAILSNRLLIANIRFPRLILPISALVESLIELLAAMVILVIVTIGFGFFTGLWLLGPGLLFLIPGILIHTLFNLGIATLAARMTVPFRDTGKVMPYALRLWLYLSPIIWPLAAIDDLPGSLRTILELNPMFALLAWYRAAFLGNPITAGDVWTSIGWAVVLGVIGPIVFVRFEDRMARFL